MKVLIDTSDLSQMVSDKELRKFVEDACQELAVDLFTELTSPPPAGTPVDTGEARNAWQVDLSNPLEPEVFNTAPYINRLNDGHSKQSPAGFIEAAIDKLSR